MSAKDSARVQLRFDKNEKNKNSFVSNAKHTEGDSGLTVKQPDENPDIDIVFQLLSTLKDGISTVKLKKIIQMIKSAGILFNRDPRLHAFEKTAEKVTGDECFRDYNLTWNEFCSFQRFIEVDCDKSVVLMSTLRDYTQPDDSKLPNRNTHETLTYQSLFRSQPSTSQTNQEENIDLEPFVEPRPKRNRLMEINLTFLTNILLKRLVIEDFEGFSETIDDLYESQINNTSGKLSDDIPELERVEENLWGVAICTIDGQRKFSGDSTVKFTMQNLCKPFLHALALSTLKSGTINEYIGHEPAGLNQEILELDKNNKPCNPIVDTGVLMLCCLLTAISFKDNSLSYMQETYNEFIKNVLDNDYMDFRAPAYLAKKDGSDLLRCIIHGMASDCKLPLNCKIETALDLYLKACSVEINAEGLSVLAATLANGGVNPFTGKKVLERHCLKDLLSSMYTFGLYDFSGESGFTVGMPMKCSISGGLMMVVPGQMGIGLYSPLLDENNISSRAYSFCVEFIKHFKLHPYDLSNGREEKKFILRRKMTKECVPYCELFNSAGKGDIREVTNLDEQKVDFFQTDPFGHNVLHVAAAGGYTEVVKYLLHHYPSLANQKDRWNRIPRDYINEIKQYETARLFDSIGKNN